MQLCGIVIKVVKMQICDGSAATGRIGTHLKDLQWIGWNDRLCDGLLVMDGWPENATTCCSHVRAWILIKSLTHMITDLALQ